MRIELTIDELVLVGVEPRDRHGIAEAIERELASARWPHGWSRSATLESSAQRAGDASPKAIAHAVRRSVLAAATDHGTRP